jgi:hypothetical protein
MLLTEPGSRVEGETPDVLRVLFHTLVAALADRGWTEEDADRFALGLLPRMHDALATAALVVRDYANE